MNTSSEFSQVGITTSPELLKMLGQRLYRNPLPLILVRELLQNSVDAILAIGGKGRIDITCNSDDNNDLNISCSDNGIGMDTDTLINIFLCVGMSKKQSDNSTGGFGIAKVALFSSDEWTLHSRDNYVSGTLSNPNVISGLKKIKSRVGTIVTAKLYGVGDEFYKFRDIPTYLKLSIPDSGRIRIYYNGELLKNPFSSIKLLHWDSTFSIRLAKLKRGFISDRLHTTAFRINGLVQYTQFLSGDIGMNTALLVDFSNIGYKPKDKDYPFSVPREGVNTKYNEKVSEVMDNLLKDTHSLKINLNAEGSKKKIKVIRGYVYYGKGFTQNDRRIMHLWEMAVNNVRQSLGLDREIVTFGLTDESVATFWDSPVGKLYLINPREFDKIKSKSGLILLLWHVACHEVSHEKGEGTHNESFTSEFWENSHVSADNYSKVATDMMIKSRRVELPIEVNFDYLKEQLKRSLD